MMACTEGRMVRGVAADFSLSLTTARFRLRILASVCEKVASDFGLGVGFSLVLRFPPPLTTGYRHE